MMSLLLIRRDITKNWDKSGYIPFLGEPILYADVHKNMPNIKIGDGIRSVENLPFQALFVDGVMINPEGTYTLLFNEYTPLPSKELKLKQSFELIAKPIIYELIDQEPECEGRFEENGCTIRQSRLQALGKRCKFLELCQMRRGEG